MPEAKTKKPAKAEKYFEAKGRRKTSVARVRLFSSSHPLRSEARPSFLVNDKKLEIYFPTKEMHHLIEEPLRNLKTLGKFKVSAKIKGGGIHSQAEALRHGISRALIKFNADFRKPLKKSGFLKRDSRAKERRKFGLKKARKAPQWSKR